jgi:hypothetical protein
MIRHVGFFILVQHVAAVTAALAAAEGACLLQLGKERSPSVELQRDGRADRGGPGRASPPAIRLTVEAALSEDGEESSVASEQAVGEQVEASLVREDEPRAPDWDQYPASLHEILDELVVTRWHGLFKETQSAGLAAPVPGLLEKFDCVIHHAFEKISPTCQTLLISPKWELMEKAKNQINSGNLNVDNGAMVAFFGVDQMLSTCQCLDLVKNIGSHFQRTYVEGYDVMDDDIDVLPIGLSEYYLRFQDWDVLSSITQKQDTITLPAKYGLVLAAFGTFWPEFNTNPSRSSAGSLCESHGQEEWLICGEIPTATWWRSLQSYKFLLDPAGGGVQSTKFYEALLARAVPICTNEAAFAKLHEKGWPILVVSSYADLANMDLTKIYEELKPRLDAIQPYLHLNGYWKYLLTGELSFI